MIARLMMRWGLFWTNRARSATRFGREREAVLALARNCPPAQGERRILIRRLPGLEDSRRFWSVYMTVEHLRIDNQSIAGVIARLARGEVPERLVSTADVKPGIGITGTVLREFEQSCDDLERTIAAVADLRPHVKYLRTPGSFAMDAGGRYDMAAFHLGVHLTQVKRILAGLKTEG